jgi:hypothetical protein
MPGKKWYQSWTLWANILALIVLVANAFGFSQFQPDTWVTEIGTVAIILINIALRYFRTSQPIEK